MCTSIQKREREKYTPFCLKFNWWLTQCWSHYDFRLPDAFMWITHNQKLVSCSCQKGEKSSLDRNNRPMNIFDPDDSSHREVMSLKIDLLGSMPKQSDEACLQLLAASADVRDDVANFRDWMQYVLDVSRMFIRGIEAATYDLCLCLWRSDFCLRWIGRVLVKDWIANVEFALLDLESAFLAKYVPLV